MRSFSDMSYAAVSLDFEWPTSVYGRKKVGKVAIGSVTLYTPDAFPDGETDANKLVQYCPTFIFHFSKFAKDGLPRPLKV